MYQTDFDGFIKKDGCLFAELVTQIEKRTRKEVTKQRIIEIVDELHNTEASYSSAYPVLSSEEDKKQPGIFVWDHEAVGNAILAELGASCLRLKYAGRQYMPWEEARGHKSFGSRISDFIILQIRTKSGAGHFRGLNHDPWQPARKMQDLKSIRYYEILSR